MAGKLECKDMRFRLLVLLMLGAALAVAQAPKATIRVEVTSESGPVQDAEVTANGKEARTGQDRVAVLPVAAASATRI